MGGKEVGFNCFLFLLENKTNLKIEISALFPNSSKLNSPQFECIKLAKEHNIPVYLNPEELMNIERPDYLISIQYHLILKDIMIQRAKNLALNLHMAPVPEYRGCNQFSFAIADGAKEFGTTLHRIEAKIDGGDVIAERRFPIEESSFAKELNKITIEESIELFKTEIGNILSDNYSLTPQSELAKMRSEGYHERKEIDSLKIIEDSWSIEKKKRYFRATYFPPYAPAMLKHGDDLIPTSMDWYNSLF